MTEEQAGRLSASLPREQRIAKRRDFVRAYEGGTKLHGRFSVLFILENSLSHPRLGITATRKLGKATARNKAKRWVREVFRRERVSLGLASFPADIVVNLKPVVATASFMAFREDFIRLLRKAPAALPRNVEK
jgi:ribonuclease P protein component